MSAALEDKLSKYLQDMLVHIPTDDISARDKAIELFRQKTRSVIDNIRNNSGDSVADKYTNIVEKIIEKQLYNYKENEYIYLVDEYKSDYRGDESELSHLKDSNDYNDERNINKKINRMNIKSLIFVIIGIAIGAIGYLSVQIANNWMSAGGYFVNNVLVDQAQGNDVAAEIIGVMKKIEEDINNNNAKSAKKPIKGGQFLSVSSVYPDLYGSLSEKARRSGEFLMQVTGSGYKIIFKGWPCIFAYQRDEKLVDRRRTKPPVSLCNYFGVWNERGSSF
ncbi:hypothetical protein [Zhengella mangrovi]|uniref:hypothetical protein n=1 Tax=Zhengella mangrovi TaxID=1982044 RepID=UPI001056C824|nr:hypothetical protein [Zhengella mangrovi]